MNALSYRLLPGDTLSAALHHYHQRQGYFPPGVTVGKGQAPATIEELRRLGCSQVAVEETGGCLANEIWLWIEERHDE